MYHIQRPERTIWGERPGPARLIAPDGAAYTFTGGYGDDNRRPTQEGCALIVAWLVAQNRIETGLSLTDALSQARDWHTKAEG